MNNIYKTLLIMPMAFTFFSCEMELEPYNHEISYLSVIDGGEEATAAKGYSFAGKPADFTEDTLFFEVKLLGNLSSKDRYFDIQQRILTAAKNEAEIFNAEVGEHFVSFDDKAITSQCLVPADSIKGTFPVIVRRHPDMKEKSFTLCVEIADGANFKAAQSKLSCKVINISEMLMQPSDYVHPVTYLIGPYGRRKHELMIEILEPYGYTVDYACSSIRYQKFDSYRIQDILRAELQKLIDKGVDITEYPEYGGQPVHFNRG